MLQIKDWLGKFFLYPASFTMPLAKHPPNVGLVQFSRCARLLTHTFLITQTACLDSSLTWSFWEDLMLFEVFFILKGQYTIFTPFTFFKWCGLPLNIHKISLFKHSRHAARVATKRGQLLHSPPFWTRPSHIPSILEEYLAIYLHTYPCEWLKGA